MKMMVKGSLWDLVPPGISSLGSLVGTHSEEEPISALGGSFLGPEFADDSVYIVICTRG